MRLHRLPVFCLALLASSPLACGGSVTSTGSGGAGADGGSGGTPGSGADGGSGGTAGSGGAQGTCSPDEMAGAYDQPPALGLASPPGSPMSAVVVSVTDTTLEYNLGPDGGTETFTWRGPPLTTVFKQGDTVTVGTGAGWHFVAGEMVAATYSDDQFVPPGALPAVPMTKAPALGYATQCQFPEAGGACEQPPADVHVLAVRAGTDADAIDVPVGETGAFGGFQIHNAQSVALPGYGSNDCVLEALFMSGVTVLGPIGK